MATTKKRKKSTSVKKAKGMSFKPKCKTCGMKKKKGPIYY